MAENGNVITSFQKNALEEVRVSLSEYKGHNLVDIRIYYVDDKGEKRPTKKGISLSVELYASLKKAIDEVEKVLTEKGLLETDEDEE